MAITYNINDEARVDLQDSAEQVQCIIGDLYQYAFSTEASELDDNSRLLWFETNYRKTQIYLDMVLEKLGAMRETLDNIDQPEEEPEVLS